MEIGSIVNMALMEGIICVRTRPSWLVRSIRKLRFRAVSGGMEIECPHWMRTMFQLMVDNTEKG